MNETIMLSSITRGCVTQCGHPSHCPDGGSPTRSVGLGDMAGGEERALNEQGDPRLLKFAVPKHLVQVHEIPYDSIHFHE